jgi:hypothetical protein
MAGTRLPARQVAGREVCAELFYRLAQNQLEIPPLRSRTEDIPELVQSIIKRIFDGSERRPSVEPRALSALRQYPWPGNVNELEAVVREAVVVAEQCGGEIIKLEHLPPHIRNADKAWFHVEPGVTRPPRNAQQGAEEPGLGAAKEEPKAAEEEAAPEEDEPPPFPEAVNRDGYRTIRIIRTTNFTRVFLAELEFNGDLVILKLLRPQNQEQSNAMRKAIALHKNKPEAQKVMVPIHHANNWSDFYLLVVDCLDNSVPGQEINRSLYRPLTFQHWLKRKKGPRRRGEVIDHLLTMLQVLDFFHHNELVFNDVKPENFGFYRGELVAIDYGAITFIGQPPHEWNPA